MKKAPPSVLLSPSAERRSGFTPEMRIPFIYFIFSSGWIIVSDLLVKDTALDPDQSTLVQSIKGLNFVIASTLLLYFVLRHSYGGWRTAEKCRLAAIQQSREQFRALSSHIEALRETDRIRIAREIHDELGQMLTGIKMEIRQVENLLEQQEDRSLHPAIDKLIEISALVDDTISSVQRISTDLRPDTLDHLGLGPAMQNEAAQFTQRSGVPCVLEVEDFATPLPPDVTTAVFRIYQEMLTNIARHAGAQRVEAQLQQNGHGLRLSVRDDGKGIDPAVLEAPNSLGLIGMLERAATIGGNMTFLRRNTGGTEITLSVPLDLERLPLPLPSPNSPPPPL